MTTHRFFLPTSAITDAKVLFTPDISWQISKVLRLKTEDEVVVLTGNGFEYVTQLEDIDRRQTTGIILDKRKNRTEPEVEIILYQALLPKEKFELVLQKATEVGVCKFIPIVSERTLLKQDSMAKKQDRWQKIIQEAAEQSERGIIPELLEPVTLKEAIMQAHGLILMAWEREKPGLLTDITLIEVAKQISLFVGPEGGFTLEEVEYFRSQGGQTVSLGPRILRSETAGIVFPAVILTTVQKPLV